jgi:hypothetical protein
VKRLSFRNQALPIKEKRDASIASLEVKLDALRTRESELQEITNKISEIAAQRELQESESMQTCAHLYRDLSTRFNKVERSYLDLHKSFLAFIESLENIAPETDMKKLLEDQKTILGETPAREILPAFQDENKCSRKNSFAECLSFASSALFQKSLAHVKPKALIDRALLVFMPADSQKLLENPIMARDVYSKATSERFKYEAELNQLKDLQKIDFGPGNEWEPLYKKCFSTVTPEYII